MNELLNPITTDVQTEDVYDWFMHAKCYSPDDSDVPEVAVLIKLNK